MNGLRTTGTWGLSGLAVVLALASSNAWAQNWTSRSTAYVSPPADDNADSSKDFAIVPARGWHPARPAGSPRPVPVSPFVEDETAKPIESATKLTLPPAKCTLAA